MIKFKLPKREEPCTCGHNYEHHPSPNRYCWTCFKEQEVLLGVVSSKVFNKCFKFQLDNLRYVEKHRQYV